MCVCVCAAENQDDDGDDVDQNPSSLPTNRLSTTTILIIEINYTVNGFKSGLNLSYMHLVQCH